MPFKPIDVCWHHGRRLCADQTLLDEMLSGPDFIHHPNLDEPVEGAIVIVPVSPSLGDVAYINNRMSSMKWVVLCIVGDEESRFPHHLMRHPNMRTWIMSPVKDKHFPPRFLINGSWPGLHDAIRKFGPQPKTLDWFFAGQVTHERRYQCVKQLRNMPNGHLLETPGFTQGMPREEYYKLMLSAKVIPCPSGPVELATARIFEAVECGCVPIVDGRTPHPEDATAPPYGYWEWFFNGEPPFIVIYDWEALPEVMAKALEHHDEWVKLFQERWNLWKQSCFVRLVRDAEILRGDACQISQS